MGDAGMKPFWMSFNASTPLLGHGMAFLAPSIEIMHAYANKHFKGLWSHVYEECPEELKLINYKVCELCYSRPEHV